MNINSWAQLMGSLAGQPDNVKVKAVNDFFNQLSFADDPQDKWQSTEEMINAGGGDCEDYAAAKFNTLRRLGVPDEKLKITYVNMERGQGKEPHMVLLYGDQVLDNVNTDIVPLAARKDLTNPVYGLNQQGVWIGDKKSQQTLKKWDSLLPRLGLMNAPESNSLGSEQYDPPPTAAGGLK